MAVYKIPCKVQFVEVRPRAGAGMWRGGCCRKQKPIRC